MFGGAAGWRMIADFAMPVSQFALFLTRWYNISQSGEMTPSQLKIERGAGQDDRDALRTLKTYMAARQGILLWRVCIVISVVPIPGLGSHP